MEAQLLSKEEVDSSEATRATDFPMVMSPLGKITRGGLPVTGGLLLGLEGLDRDAIAMNPEAFTTYKMSYRCKHCGKVWAKIAIEKKPLPRDYVIDEEEKTDADAKVEEEAAREEEYAREQ